jgi:hypothetical protein
MARLGAEAAGTLGVWDLSHSPILWHVRWLASGAPLDLAAARAGWPALAAVAGLFIPAFALWAIPVRKGRPRWAAACLAAALLASLGLPGLFAGDPAYYPGRRDLLDARASLTRDVRPGDLLAVNAYGTPAWLFWMNWGNDRPPWISLPFAGLLQAGLSQGTAADSPQLDSIKQRLAGQLEAGRRVWLLLPCDSASSQAGLDHLLAGLGARLNRRSFQDGGCTSHLLLLTPPAR